MRILVVCSGLDFINYTRRATLEAIHDLNHEMEILMFNSILNRWKKLKLNEKIRFHKYYFWIVERARRFKILTGIELFIREYKWRKFFKKFEVVFFIDPNQYYLLPYLDKQKKLVYLLRDPSLLLDPTLYHKELSVVKRADLILAVSENLSQMYFEKYYKFQPENIKLWSNTVDVHLWDYYRWYEHRKSYIQPVIGLAGNIDFVIDLELIKFIVTSLPEYLFEVAGKLDLSPEEEVIWKEILSFPNFKYCGFISYNEFPGTVMNWTIGLVAARNDNEYSNYLNNNKQYQYIALGKPFVTYRLNADYSIFEDMVFIAEDRSDYITKINEAIIKSYANGTVEQGIRIARSQSSRNRAEQFLSYVKEIL